MTTTSTTVVADHHDFLSSSSSSIDDSRPMRRRETFRFRSKPRQPQQPLRSSSSCCTPQELQQQRHPYRIHFSITEKSRSWMRAPRRSIKWVFGLALRQGESWKVEEQQVILTWNTKSGKIKSVQWNQYEILHLVRFRACATTTANPSSLSDIACSWRLRTGQHLQLYVRPELTSERERYTLRLDGHDFARFPTMRELEQQHSQSDEDLGHRRSSRSSSTTKRLSDYPLSSEQDIRLSMAGFVHHSNITFSCGCFLDDDDTNKWMIRDELHSDLYSPPLDALRRTITTSLPAAEPIISRAIAHAFCTASSSSAAGGGSSSMTSSCDSLSVYSWDEGVEGCSCPSAGALEASVLKGALEWTRRRQQQRDEVDDERRLQFLQKLIDELLLHFRNENIDAKETARIVLGAAVVLGLELEQEIPRDTVLVCDTIPKNLSEHDLIHHLQQRYGDIRTAAIAPFSGIGFARFVSAADAQRAASAEQPEDDYDLHLLLVAPSTDFSSDKRDFSFADDIPKAPVILRRHRRRSSTTTLDSTDHTTTSAGSEDTTTA